MNPWIGRWTLLVWMDLDEIANLHHREVSLGTRSWPSNTMLFKQRKMPTWEADKIIALAIARKFPDGCWPKTMTQSEQSQSISDFGRAIYPIWKGIDERDWEADAKLSQAEVNASGQILYDILTLHRQDLAIYASGIKPRRDSMEMQAMADLRAKAARASAY